MLEAVRAIKIGNNKETAGDLIDQGRCPICCQIVGGFRDGLSRREFTISGLCQGCQDLTYTEPPKSRQEVLDEAGS